MDICLNKDGKGFALGATVLWKHRGDGMKYAAEARMRTE